MKIRFGLLAMVLGALGLRVPVNAAVTTFTPLHDNTIFSEFDYSNALGALYVGRTPNVTTRRALMEFDIAGSIPSGATITSVSLTLNQTKVGPGATTSFDLRKLNASWGEGTSAGAGSGGLATPNDATWNYRFYTSTSWSTPGADYGAVSASVVLATNGQYTVDSTPALVADVQGWLNSPSSNNGWIFRAADESFTSAREIGSRETATPPQLTVTYSVPEPTTGIIFGAVAFIAGRRRSRRCAA